MIKLTNFALALLLALAVSLPTAAQTETAGELSEAQVIERILELQRQIDELIASLPPAARAELEKRLAERGAPAAVPAPAAELPAEAPRVAAAERKVQPPPAAAEPPVRRRLVRGPHCNFLTAFDSNQDGKVSALDRYWRHLFLWSDANGDRQIQEAEVASAYERNVREIAVDLDTFIRKKGTIGEVRVGEHLLLDVRGDGFDGGDDGVLVVDATRLRRGTGPDLQSASGEPLGGFQPLQEGRQIREGNGEITVLRCR